MRKTNRDISIEVIRIIACFFVVIMHVETAMFRDGVLIRQALVLACIVGDAVAVFFAITGCFWFRSQKGYKYVILSFLKNIVFPTICMIILLQIFSPYYSSTIIPLRLSDLSLPDIKGIIKGVLSRDHREFGEVFGAYWYLFEYACMLLWYPMIRYICKHNKMQILVFIVVVTFINCICKEAQWLIPLSFTIPSIAFFPVALVEMIEGHIIYSKREVFRKKNVRYICFMTIIAAMVLRYFLQKALFGIDPNNNKFLFWDESIAFIVIAGVFGFMMSFDFTKMPNKLLVPVLSIGKLTFYIFLIHAAVIRKVINIGMYWKLYNVCMERLPLPFVTFDLLMGIIVFLICLPFAWIARIMIDSLYTALQRLVRIMFVRIRTAQ